MHAFKYIIALAVALLSLPATAQVYRCPSAQGTILLQQTPCGDGERMDVRPASGRSNAGTAQDAQARLAKLKSDNAMAEAIRTHVPLIGMTRKQLRQAMGVPTHVNAGDYAAGIKDQLVFERPSGTWRVYLNATHVTDIQYSSMITAAPEPAPRHCPSALEIRNAEVSASSMTLTEAERAGRWRAIAEMKACKR